MDSGVGGGQEGKRGSGHERIPSKEHCWECSASLVSCLAFVLHACLQKVSRFLAIHPSHELEASNRGGYCFILSLRSQTFSERHLLA